ncbi:sphingosine kinase 1-like isoform X2 [Anneissia japonica]|uniref:sphingosine kinase 1-like isoform X2 n=1 Tax=Anneissia japonica TaxID=1529436 RepID=UPI0014259E15|nr:sphingosine kinase 1-like isoform X2 [Anneissia japonica]XP_033108013.1 sphingosine kinase 1-like isoform X2 [Anneissia japonica]XP_033108014.1 sphingosine kinase 1-like isoform X2 [Anneissia japonica]XP_033108016.1 sphingosine kinase 1-like isoform X2 [Anneissia japonica]
MQYRLSHYKAWGILTGFEQRTMALDSRHINHQDVENLSVPRPRKMLVFVNPYSGTRRAEPIFHKKVAPLFDEADIKYELVITERQFHAKKMVEELEDLNSYNGIVIISGDGLVYEVLNGLMARKDRHEALKIPIGVVPGGSGNALAACVLSAEQDSYRKNAVLHSAFTIAKGGKQPMDLVKVQTPSVSMYSFLCISWAMISDIDIESERFRSFGAVRFLLGAIVRTICLRRYQGRLSYLPVEDTSRYEEHFSKPLQQVEKDLSRQTNLGRTCSKSLPVLDSEPRLINIRPIGTSPSFPSSFPNQCSNSNTLHNFVEEHDVNDVEMSNVSDSTNSVKHQPNIKDTTDNSSTNNSNKTLLSPLDQPVPSNWVTIEGEFIGFCAVYTSHISQDAYMWPGRKSDEGVISIQYVMSPLSRASIASLLLAFEDASHTQSDNLRTVFAQAFRLESLEPDRGILTIDGEALEKGTSCIQAEVIQRKFQIIRPGNGTSTS